MEQSSQWFGQILLYFQNQGGNFALSIFLLTFFTKVLLLPVSLWVQKNSMTMLRLQVEVLQMKSKYYGDPERLAQEQSALYKKEKYNPFSSLIPLFCQLFLLISLIHVLNQPLAYLIQADSPQRQEWWVAYLAENPFSAETPTENDLFRWLREEEVIHFETEMGQYDLLDTPTLTHQNIFPLMAGVTALLLCLLQNKVNVLQATQSTGAKGSTMAVSVGISLFLGFSVPSSVVFYWICSNVLTMVQVVLFMLWFPTSKYVEMEALEKAKEDYALAKERSGGTEKKRKWGEKNPYGAREKEDYKRFFSVGNKKIVIFSESNGFYKYYEALVEELLAQSNVTIHYVTSDPEDKIFQKAEEEPRIKGYYMGEKRLIVLMMKLDSELCVMTTPDLERYHIKRSRVKRDVEYIYLFHAPLSHIMTLNHGALDHYDTVFSTGKYQTEEIQTAESLYGSPEKRVIEYGYPLIERMMEQWESLQKDETQKKRKGKPKILIAPSWYQENILDSCGKKMLEELAGESYEIVVRPHPEYVKRYGQRWEALQEELRESLPAVNFKKIQFQSDFSKTSTVYEADLLVTDWSLIAFEYSFTTERPVLFVDTKKKVTNERYQEVSSCPPNESLRNELGLSLKPEEMGKKGKLKNTVKELLHTPYEEKIQGLKEEYLYDGRKKTGSAYILGRLTGSVNPPPSLTSSKISSKTSSKTSSKEKK